MDGTPPPHTFLAVLGFELRALCLLSSHCTTRVVLPALYMLVIFKIGSCSQASVAPACNPSKSGGRDQKGSGLKPAWANSSQDPMLKTPNTVKGRGLGLVEWLKL
jgi:hypothetical protein